jgi:hypothetical protein
MKITTALLRQHNACNDGSPGQVDLFEELYPNGLIPDVASLSEAAAAGLDVWWAWHLLPEEGPGSQRAYALWCAEQVEHLTDDPRVHDCLAVVRRRVQTPNSVSDRDLEAAREAARDAAGAAAWAAAWEAEAAAGAAAWAAREAAGAAARDAQLACLAGMLEEGE